VQTTVEQGRPLSPREALRTAPIVTALIVTYNHRPYIEAAMESVLGQSTTFAVEIIVSEDASRDGTREIVLEFARRHPARIRPLLSTRNVRSNEVVARGLRLARGRYVALLDGDDWWCAADKLQRQYDFLEANPGYAAVFHNALVAVRDRLTDRCWTPQQTARTWAFADLIEGNPFATCAGMMRTECVRGVPDWYADFFPITDWPLYLLCAMQGDLRFEDEISGVYRLHEGGEFSSQSTVAKHAAVESFYRRLARVGDARLATAAGGGCSRYFLEWAKTYLKEGDLTLARSCFRRSLFGGGLGHTVAPREMLRLGAKLALASVVP
jgi:glycosyltransferase involved in cell wall biosynthesis